VDGLAEFPHQSFDIVYCRVDRVLGPLFTLVACLTWNTALLRNTKGQRVVVTSNKLVCVCLFLFLRVITMPED
jgi:hypothetical protein